MNTHHCLARLATIIGLVSVLTLNAVTLKNSTAQWQFADSGSLAQINSQQVASGWLLMLRASGGHYDTLSSQQIPASAVSLADDKAVITWRDLQVPFTTATVTIRQTVVLQDNGATIWETTVEGLPEQLQSDIASPLISLSQNQEPSVLAIPEQTGRLYQKPFELGHLELAYPAQASMQFIAFTTGNSGLLLYSQDPRWFSKKLIAETHDTVLSFAIAQAAATNTAAPVVVRPFTGDATTAARLYGEWAIPHINVTPMSPWPGWLVQTPFFAMSNHEPTLALNQWLNLRNLTSSPFAAIYRNYTIAKHNENAPECFPADPYFNSATHIAPSIDCSLAPMIPSRLWASEQTEDAVHTADGLPLINRKNNGKAITTLCPATRAWQDKLLENARKLIVDYGCKAVTIEDLLTSDIDCTCEQHGHAKRIFPAVQTIADMLDRIKTDLRKERPDLALLTTGLHEGLIGHVDAAIITSSALPENCLAAPLFQNAYGSRMIIAGTHLSFQDQREQAIYKLYTAFATGTRFITNDFSGHLDPAEPLPRLIREAAQLQTCFTAMTDCHSVPCQLVTAQQQHDDALPRLFCGTPDSIRTVSVADAHTLLFAIFNLSAIPQNLTLTVPEKLLPAQPVAMQLPQTPLDNPAQTNVTVNPYSLTAIRISNAPLPDSSSPLPTDLQLLFAGDDEYFPLCKGTTTQELWACDDAFVARNPIGRYGMFQPMNKFKSVGIRKSALNEEFPKGDKAIGNPLPRHHDDQPFGIIRKLPHTLTAKAIVYTLFGDESCIALNGAIPKGAVFNTPKPGVFAARIITNDGAPKGTFQFFSTPQQLNEALARDNVKMIVSIAYTAMDDATLNQAQEFAAAHQLDMTAFTAAWNNFTKHADMARLAALSRASQELFRQANHCQHFFAIGAPGWKLLHQGQACVKAATIFADSMNSPCLAPEHDWLIPGIPKPVLTFFVNPSPQSLINATTLIPLGLRNPQAATYTTIENTESDHYPGFEFLLNDDSACHSQITLSAWTVVPVEGEQLLAMDMTWLTVNQPLYPFYFPHPLFIGPGKTTSLQFGLLNNTPFKLDTAIAPEIPAGWTITAEPQLLSLDCFDFNKISLVIKGGDKLAEGLGSIIVNPLLDNALHADPKAIIPFDAINPPVLAGTANSLDGKQTLIAQSFALYAFFAKKNERIVITVKNVSSEFAGWNLYNPNLENVRNGKLKKEEFSKITLTAVRDAAYLLKIIASDEGEITITSSTHALSLRASAAHPFIFTTDAPAQHAFFVPQDATQVICQADHQHDGTTAVTIIAPDKQVYTLRGSAPVSIPVSQYNADKPWLLSAKKAKGTAIRLSGDAVPWLAPSPETVLSHQ